MERKKKILILGASGIVFFLMVVLFLFFWKKQKEQEIPTLEIETPQKISEQDSEEFVLKVTISDLGDAIYPAASVSICFDSFMLEFLGVEEGNVLVHSTEHSQGKMNPQWSYNVEQSNKTGKINIMYLDMTGGKNAFSKELLGNGEHVVLGLKFRLRAGAVAGNICDLLIEDAVFAASDETNSLAMVTGTLKIKNSKIVVGE